MAIQRRGRRSGFCALLLFSMFKTSHAATLLTDNLAGISGGFATAGGTMWEAQSFTTDNQSYDLTSVTLVISSLDANAALYLYSDSASAPSQVLGELSLASSYATDLAETLFTASDLALAANTTYWIVLTDTAGAANWSFQASDSGNSASWAEWDGTFWATSSAFPFQLSVSAEPVVSSVPLPAALLFWLTGLAFAGLNKRLHNKTAVKSEQGGL